MFSQTELKRVPLITAMMVLLFGDLLAHVVVAQEHVGEGTYLSTFSNSTLSGDGKFAAHLGPNGFEDGLFVTNIKTGEDRKILATADNYTVFDGISFSSDSDRLAFYACPSMGSACNLSNVFSVRTDGSDLTKVATSWYDPSSGETLRVLLPHLVRGTAFSPDGKKVLIAVEGATSQPPEAGRPAAPSIKNYVGIALSDGTRQHPSLVAEGEPLFWAASGDAVYYVGQDELVYRLNVNNLQSAPVTRVADTYRNLLGKVPDADAVFAIVEGDRSLAIVNLRGVDASDDMVRLAQHIPIEDSGRRRLKKIELKRPNQLELQYAPAKASEDSYIREIPF